MTSLKWVLGVMYFNTRCDRYDVAMRLTEPGCNVSRSMMFTKVSFNNNNSYKKDFGCIYIYATAGELPKILMVL